MQGSKRQREKVAVRARGRAVVCTWWEADLGLFPGLLSLKAWLPPETAILYTSPSLAVWWTKEHQVLWSSWHSDLRSARTGQNTKHANKTLTVSHSYNFVDWKLRWITAINPGCYWWSLVWAAVPRWRLSTIQYELYCMIIPWNNSCHWLRSSFGVYVFYIPLRSLWVYFLSHKILFRNVIFFFSRQLLCITLTDLELVL